MTHYFNNALFQMKDNDYVFPYVMHTDFIANQSVHPLLQNSYQSFAVNTPSYTDTVLENDFYKKKIVLTRQENGLWIPILHILSP